MNFYYYAPRTKENFPWTRRVRCSYCTEEVLLVVVSHKMIQSVLTKGSTSGSDKICVLHLKPLDAILAITIDNYVFVFHTFQATLETGLLAAQAKAS